MTGIQKLVEYAVDSIRINGTTLNTGEVAVLYHLAYQAQELGKKRTKKIPKKKAKKKDVQSKR